jgi:hypothetical protein
MLWAIDPPTKVVITPVPTTSFPLGRIVSTPGALNAMVGDDPMAYLARHARGDWGVVCDADRRLNDQAVKDGTRLLSAYLRDGSTRI